MAGKLVYRNNTRLIEMINQLESVSKWDVQVRFKSEITNYQLSKSINCQRQSQPPLSQGNFKGWKIQNFSQEKKTDTEPWNQKSHFWHSKAKSECSLVSLVKPVPRRQSNINHYTNHHHFLFYHTFSLVYATTKKVKTTPQIKMRYFD